MPFNPNHLRWSLDEMRVESPCTKELNVDPHFSVLCHACDGNLAVGSKHPEMRCELEVGQIVVVMENRHRNRRALCGFAVAIRESDSKFARIVGAREFKSVVDAGHGGFGKDSGLAFEMVRVERKKGSRGNVAWIDIEVCGIEPAEGPGLGIRISSGWRVSNVKCRIS